MRRGHALRRFWTLVGSAALLCLLTLPSQRADATIVLKLDVDGLTTSADAIVVGQVSSLSSRWEGKRIVTEIKVRVAVPIMGRHDKGAELVVTVLGGRVGDLAQRVPGVTHFKRGEQVLLFLSRAKASTALRVVGLAQGKYNIVRGPDEKLWAARDLSELSLAAVVKEGDKKVARITEEAAEDLGAMPLSRLLSEVVEGMREVAVPVRSELFESFGEDLSKDLDLPGLDIRGER